jgi:hypothetical protein
MTAGCDGTFEKWKVRKLRTDVQRFGKDTLLCKGRLLRNVLAAVARLFCSGKLPLRFIWKLIAQLFSYIQNDFVFSFRFLASKLQCEYLLTWTASNGTLPFCHWIFQRLHLGYIKSPTHSGPGNYSLLRDLAFPTERSGASVETYSVTCMWKVVRH